MTQETLTPQKNSEIINMLWEATFGKVYGGWKGFPKYMQTVFVNTMDRNRIFSDMGNNGPTRKQAGHIVRYREQVIPGNTILPGKSAMYLDGVRYDFYHELQIRYVMGQNGVNTPSVDYKSIQLQKGMKMMNPMAEPETVKFLMLSMYNQDSPVYWDKAKQKKYGVDVAHPYPNQVKPKFYFYDQVEEDNTMMVHEIEIGNVIAKIALLSPDELEAVAEKLGIVVPSTSSDPMTHMRFNVQQKAKQDPERVKDAMGRLVSSHIAIHTAVKAGNFRVEDRKWYAQGTDEEGKDMEVLVWEEPMNADLSDTEKMDMLASHLSEHFPDIYKFYDQGVAERRKARADVGKPKGKPGRKPIKTF